MESPDTSVVEAQNNLLKVLKKLEYWKSDEIVIKFNLKYGKN